MPPVTTPAPVPTDEIYDRYLKKAIAEINELGHDIERAAARKRAVPVLGSGHPLGDIMLLKHSPRPAEVQEGVAFFGRSGQAILKSLQRLHVDPMAIYGTNASSSKGATERQAKPWLGARAAHRPAKARRRHGRRRTRLPERAPTSRSRRPSRTRRASSSRSRRRSRRSSCRTWTHRWTSRRRNRASGRPSRPSAPGGPSSLRTDPRGPLRGRRGVPCRLLLDSRARSGSASTWWDVAFISLVLIPAVFLLVCSCCRSGARSRCPCSSSGSRSSRSRPSCSSSGWDAAAGFAKLGAVTALGWWFLGFFEQCGVGRRRRGDHPVRRRILGLEGTDASTSSSTSGTSSPRSRSHSRCPASTARPIWACPTSCSSPSSSGRRRAFACAPLRRGSA